MSTQVSNARTTAVEPFTRWHREMDGPRLRLVVESEDGGRIVECVELDVRELPNRPDLLGRLGEKVRNRLLDDAARTAEEMAGVQS